MYCCIFPFTLGLGLLSTIFLLYRCGHVFGWGTRSPGYNHRPVASIEYTSHERD